jgi:hypothetical protein
VEGCDRENEKMGKVAALMICLVSTCLFEVVEPGCAATTETTERAKPPSPSQVKNPSQVAVPAKSPIEAQSEKAANVLKSDPNNTEALSVLRKNLKSPVAFDRAATVIAARKAGRNARGIVPELMAALKDESTTVRGESATTLGAIGPDAKAAIPALKNASTSSHPPEQGAGCCMVQRDMWVQAAAQEALKRLTAK